MTTALVNFYEILQISSNADDEQIRKAIKRERRTWVKRQAHPDADRRAEAEARVRHLDQAEKTLLDAAARAGYDRQLAEYRPPTTDAQLPAGDDDWLQRARVYLDLGNANAANYAAREAIIRCGSSDEAWFIRAHSSFLLGRPSDAEYEFSEAIRLRPDNAEYHFGLGEVYGEQAKWQPAMREFEQALRLDPGNPSYRTGIAQVLLATDQAAKALAVLEKVVAEHPDNAVFKYYLGAALHDAAVENMTKDPRGGGWVITSEEQAGVAERNADRMEALGLADPEIDRLARGLREQAAHARGMVWINNGTLRWYVGAFVVFGLFPLVSGEPGPVLWGLLVCAVLTGTYITRHYKARWELARRTLGVHRAGI
ncbi:MAG TPA: tetratricopeptide repeat protein [Pseudonocardiaceae bacterium]|nr:tetratricopeptide repeat protein [Pseudonocardiaceae bacterium]